MNTSLPWTSMYVDATRLALSRRVKSTLPRQPHADPIHIGVQCKNNQGVALSGHHATFQTSIHLVSVITQKKEKDVSFSRKEDRKIEWGVGSFLMLTNISNFNPTHFSLKAIY